MSYHQAPNTYVEQVSLRISDLQRSLQFYQQVLKLRVLEQSADRAVLTADGKTPLIHLRQLEHAENKSQRTTGLYHFALLLPTRADLANILQHLADIHYPIGASDHKVSEALYLDDPDGNGIEIYADRPPEQWEWSNSHVVMTTEPLNVQDLLREKNDQLKDYLPADTIIGHIHLHVAQLSSSEKFYCDGLGFNLVTRYGTQALFISTGNYHHHIGMNTWAGVDAPQPEAHHPGMDWFSLVYPSRDELKQTIERLQAMGAEVKQNESNQWTVNDPSGNRILMHI